jgi:hypothetical protein
MDIIGKSLTATIRPAGRKFVHELRADDEVVDTRTSQHEYAFAIVWIIDHPDADNQGDQYTSWSRKRQPQGKRDHAASVARCVEVTAPAASGPVTEEEGRVDWRKVLAPRIERCWAYAKEHRCAQLADVMIERSEEFGPPGAGAYGSEDGKAMAAILRGEDQA